MHLFPKKNESHKISLKYLIKSNHVVFLLYNSPFFFFLKKQHLFILGKIKLFKMKGHTYSKYKKMVCFHNNNNNVQFLYSAYYKIVSMRLDTREREREERKEMKNIEL